MEVTEFWDSERKEIAVKQVSQMPMPGAGDVSQDVKDKMNANIQAIMAKYKFAKSLRKELGMPSGDDAIWERIYAETREMADVLLAKGLIDPAFAHALRTLDFIPRYGQFCVPYNSQHSLVGFRPLGRRHTKRQSEENQLRWNAAVDSYISRGDDSRTRAEIERAAKIGLSGGALYQRCEGVGCDKVEGKNIEKLKPCSRCKLVSALPS